MYFYDPIRKLESILIINVGRALPYPSTSFFDLLWGASKSIFHWDLRFCPREFEGFKGFVKQITAIQTQHRMRLSNCFQTRFGWVIILGDQTSMAQMLPIADICTVAALASVGCVQRHWHDRICRFCVPYITPHAHMPTIILQTCRLSPPHARLTQRIVSWQWMLTARVGRTVVCSNSIRQTQSRLGHLRRRLPTRNVQGRSVALEFGSRFSRVVTAVIIRFKDATKINQSIVAANVKARGPGSLDGLSMHVLACTNCSKCFYATNRAGKPYRAAAGRHKLQYGLC